MEFALVALATHTAVLITGIIVSQRVKDFIRGIPADMRAGLNKVEQAAIARVKQGLGK